MNEPRYGRPTPDGKKALDDFVNSLPLVMEKAHRLGLHRTGHKLHDAVRESGWELADILTGKQAVPRGA